MAGLMEVSKDFAKKFDVTNKDARKCVEFILNDVTERVGKGETVNLTHFGVFRAKDVAARTIQNPRTGEPAQVPATVRCTFKASEHMKVMIKAARGMASQEELDSLAAKSGVATTETAETAEPVAEDAIEAETSEEAVETPAE